MDVDPADDPVPAESAAASNLKRSCSAPMIDQIDTATGASSPVPTVDRSRHQRSPAPNIPGLSPNSSSVNYWRSRRLSANYGSLSSPSSPHGVAPRVQQLKKEEGLDEARHESALHSTLKLSQSWNDLTVGEEGSSVSTSISDPLTVNLGPWAAPGPTSPVTAHSSSSSSSSHAASFLAAHHPHLMHHHSSPLPSPTRGARVTAQLPMRSVSFSPSPSPSPTRKTFTTRRSQSPIAMRASQLLLVGGVKRKCDLDPGDDASSSPSAPKRLFGGPNAGLLMPQPRSVLDSPSPGPSGGSGISSGGNAGFETPPSSVGSAEGQGTPGIVKSTPATPGSLARAMEEVMVTSSSEMSQGQ